MKRRTFLTSSAGLAAATVLSTSRATEKNDFVAELIPSEIPKSQFKSRLERAQRLMEAEKLDALIATPGTNFTYFVGYNPGRSERLIAFVMSRDGRAMIVAPSFEKERIIRRSVVSDIEVWEEQENPYKLAGLVAAKLKVAAGTIGIEPSTAYEDYLRLKQEMPNASLVDGSPIFDELRMAKSPEELDAIRKAIEITVASIAATHEKLREEATEQEVSRILSSEMGSRGARGGGLVQFGSSSALPHGGPTGAPLKKGTVVLIDAGCQVDGYTSDITRTMYWGGDAPQKYREVYSTVFDAQQAAATLAKPGVECQEMDRVGRAVIDKAGYGKYFTHRLGHGLGMDGHELPYLVEGNSYKLKPGHVVTIEPGIYIPDEFGVRIEDDFVITENGVEQLSPKAHRI
ncbi:MAG: Xaa-Pro peptidase family protein [Bacteroidota bacterium]